MDIATRARDVFEKSSNLELKRLVLKFVFEKIILTEGILTYKLKFPFNEFENVTLWNTNGMGAYELRKAEQNIALQANDNKNIEKITNLSCEPQILDKNQGVAPKNATPFQIGGEGEIRTHGGVAPSTVFKTAALNRSATSPQ